MVHLKKKRSRKSKNVVEENREYGTGTNLVHEPSFVAE